jgi:alpha-methylacyl-CoA racemase
MVLSDFGADVVRVDRVRQGTPWGHPNDTLARGKRSVALDLKCPDGREALARLAEQADVLIEPFRPGKMEALGLGPDSLCARCPRLVYARMTGFGQGGDAHVGRLAGHDINYLALSGVLSALRERGRRPVPPGNVLGDFAGGGMLCALGVCLALLERERSGRGQVVDAAMVDGAAYLSSFLFMGAAAGVWRNGIEEVGGSMLDGGAPFYRTYACADGGHVSVGAIEPRFNRALRAGLRAGLRASDGALETAETRGPRTARSGLATALLSRLESADMPAQMDADAWPAVHARYDAVFAQRPRDAWARTFGPHGEFKDACVVPVLSFREAAQAPHNVRRGTFLGGGASTSANSALSAPGARVPAPAPRLSRTPARPGRCSLSGPAVGMGLLEAGAHTREVMAEWLPAGHGSAADALIASGAAAQAEEEEEEEGEEEPTRSRL